MAAVDQLSPLVGVKPACQALAVPRASWYRRRSRHLFPRPAAGPRFSSRALTEAERQAVLSSLHEERFQDCSPAQVYAALLDAGRFIARSAPCTDCWKRAAKAASAAIS